ncbi:MAG: class I SAM-dependent methyltransferase [Gammaproteobacteria bacterium]|nr:class I SAM-dependent methyltransferase [Gammaproteobacteria bacterium]
MASGKKNRKSKPSIASKADKHKLYEKAVQCVEVEIDFVDATYTQIRKKKAKTLREDFCGTANTSCEWVRRRPGNTAIGIDLDPDVQQWGREHNIARLNDEQKKRIRLVNSDVMTACVKPVDIVLAMNFSYWIFKDRVRMIDYFRKVRQGLKKDGIFILDACGGYEAIREMTEESDYGKFTYVWDQDKYNPITGDYLCRIHFKFKDGSKMKNAFTYDWRFWTLPELTEMLTEAGFKAEVYWEGTGKDGEGNGVFKPAKVGEADAGWIVYIVAEK